MNSEWNGLNPTYVIPDSLINCGSEYFKEIVFQTDVKRSRCAISYLSHFQNMRQNHSFWIKCLTHKDVIIRDWAISNLADIADRNDLESVMAQLIETGAEDIRHTLAVRLRLWNCPEVVPLLIELLSDSCYLIRENAGLSLTYLKFLPVLEPDREFRATRCC
ncbi:MAG TPA: hypothetical protein VHO70_09715 [Chitinispirillaceae bacterium]|nr:hypothetical protein [Chitinispirillaceae bacterium]